MSRTLSILFLAVISLPLPVTLLYLDLFKHESTSMPEFSWDVLIDGELGDLWNQWLLDNSIVSKMTGKIFREFRLNLFKDSNPNIQVGQDHWLFLPERKDEISSNKLEQLGSSGSEALESVFNTLKEANISLLVVIIPNRSRIYPEFAYEDGRIPPNREKFIPELLSSLTEKRIPFLSLEQIFIKEKLSGHQLFYKDDHHWTMKGAEIAMQAVAKAIHFKGRKLRQKPYEVIWKRKSSGSSLIRILGLREGGNLEKLYKDEQISADFVPPRVNREFLEFESGGVGLLSASYGLFGSPEFLSNELMTRVGFITANGDGPLYAPSQFISEYLSQNGRVRPAILVWPIPEYHFWEIAEEPTRVPKGYLGATRRIAHEVGATDGFKLVNSNTLLQTKGKAHFSVELDQSITKIRLIIRSKKHGKRSLIRSLESQEIPLAVIHSGHKASHDFRLRTEFRRVDFEITSTELGKRFEIIGVESLD